MEAQDPIEFFSEDEAENLNVDRNKKDIAIKKLIMHHRKNNNIPSNQDAYHRDTSSNDHCQEKRNKYGTNEMKIMFVCTLQLVILSLFPKLMQC